MRRIARALKRLIAGLALIAIAAAAAAALPKAAPLAQVALAAGVALAAVVYFAARAGAPRWFGIRHLFGLAFAALALWLHGLAWSGLAAAPDLAGFDIEAARSAAIMPPEAWPTHLTALADRMSFQAGGRMIGGETLAVAWIVGAAAVLIAGLLGGHGAYWRGRTRPMVVERA